MSVPKLMDKIDINRHLVGFDNGTYDLDEMRFRAGNQEDLITMSVGYDWEDLILFETDNRRKMFNTFFEEIVPDPAERKYLLVAIASCLYGENSDEIFPCCSGVGSNGKTLMDHIITLVFGDYSGVIDTTYFTQKDGDANKPDAIIMGLFRKRYVSMCEPDKRAELNVAKIKKHTGKDGVSARGLFDKTVITRIPQYTIFAFWNQAPKIEDSSKGLERRLKEIEFKTRFVAKPEHSHEKILNKNLSKTLGEHKLTLFKMLLEHYTDYKTNGLSFYEPDSVTINSKLTVKSNDNHIHDL